MNAKEARSKHDEYQKHKFTETVQHILVQIEKVHRFIPNFTHIGTLKDLDVQQLKAQGFDVKQDKKIAIISW